MSENTKKTFTIDVDERALTMLEAAYTKYAAKKDIINTIFELHKFDEDASVIDSVPFEKYENDFAAAKIEYDMIMKETEKQYITDEMRGEKGCRFNVDFDNNCIIVTQF